MDCQTALEILECARPGSTDFQEPEIMEASQHLAHCVECDRTFHRHQNLDHQIAAAMCDVPIPADLLDRLFASQASCPSENGSPVAKIGSDRGEHPLFSPIDRTTRPSNTTSVNERVQPLPKRRWLRGAFTSVTICLLVLTGIWLFPRGPGHELTLPRIIDQISLSIDELDDFDGNFTPQLPGDGWNSDRLYFSSNVKGFSLHADGPHQMALVPFRFPVGAAPLRSGVLVVIPDHLVDHTGLPTSFRSSGQVLYKNDGDYTTITWKSGSYVYACFVPSEDNSREHLERLLQGLAT